MKKKRVMVNKFYYIIPVVLIFIILLCICANQKQTTNSDLQNILDGEWQSFIKDKPNFKGGMAIQILSSKGEYFLSTGMGDDVTSESHFRVASVTKTFTSAGIMLLNQKGLLDINDKITNNIPGTNVPYIPNTTEYDIPYKENITIRMLLMHRAGIFDLANSNVLSNDAVYREPYIGSNYIEYIKSEDPKHTFTFDELLSIDAKNKLSYFEPGSSYHYSNTGYSMLGKIIERVSGKSYSEFIETELLIPNNLTETSSPYLGSDQKMPEPFSRGYVWINETIMGDVTESNMAPHVAEGNIISTPRDLANWCKRLFEGKAGLTKETVEMMKSGMPSPSKQVPDAKYGLGISIPSETDYGHSGAHEGYLTLMSYDPYTDVVYVTYTNVWDCQTCGKSTDSIISELLFLRETTNKIIESINN